MQLTSAQAWWQSIQQISIGGAALSCSYSPITIGSQGVAYTGATPSASGGTPAYTFSETGSLPTGLTINSTTGVISGTPSVNGSFPGIQVKVTDNVSTVANCSTSFTLVISASVIKSIQASTITLGAGVTTNTATISAITTANAILVWNGKTSTTASASSEGRSAARIAITNTTTITATRGPTTDSVTVSFTVVEFASGVNSIQAGTIAVASGNTSGTATISAVGANAFVLYQGASESITSPAETFLATGVTLTNSTTVTANVINSAGSTQTVGYMVADLDSTIVNSVQQKAVSISSASASDTDTLTSVTTGNTLLFWGGTSSASATSYGFLGYDIVLTNATTVTKTRTGNGSTARTIYYTAVQLASTVVGSIQRGTIALSATTSNTATITSVDTTKSFVNWGGFLAVNGNNNVTEPSLTLTNATTITAAVNSAGSPTVSYEVLQFN